MSRRNQLKVDTFPFLAVLLCAMGSLILVLLVMDRRSKLAARQRVAEEVRRQAEDHASAHSRRREEYDAKKRSQQAAWSKKRDALHSRVSAEEKALDAELRQVQARLAEAAKKLRKEEENVRSLRGQLSDEQARLASREKTLDGARQEARTLTGKLSDADKARAKLASDLAQLETLLAATKEARQRDGQTYSVIPYNGKHGDGRRPLYVECSEAGMLFHPDKAKLDAPSAEALLAEVKKRVAKQAEELAAQGVKDARAYIMLLVRPSGIMRHYEMQAVAKELGIDFGYEFVDADWVFNILDTPAPGNTRIATEPASPKEPRFPTRLPGTGGGIAPKLVSREGGGTAVGGGPALPGLSSIDRGTSTKPSLGVGLNPPRLYSASGENKSGQGSRPAMPNPDGPMVSMHRPMARWPQGATEGLELPPILPPMGATAPRGQAPAANPPLGTETPPVKGPTVREGFAPPQARQKALPHGRASDETVPPAGAGNGPPGTATANAGGTNPGGGKPGFAGPRPAGQPVPMRPARVSGGDDRVIYVECRPDTVVVYPARQQIGIDSLNHTPLHNPLTRTVNQIIARQKALVRPGTAPARFLIRYLVHPGGELTYHRAYPALETVSAPKKRYNLMADDDVARIVAGY